MKKENRFIAFSAGFHQKNVDQETLLVGTIFRGGELLEGVVSSKISVDGDDGTDLIIQLVNSCKFKPQLKVILLGAITLAGFNVIDVARLYNETKIPIMIVLRNQPNLQKIQNLLVKLKMNQKIPLIEQAGPLYEDLGIFFQVYELTEKQGIEVLEITMTQADYPEPLRIAKMIANGIVRGAS